MKAYTRYPVHVHEEMASGGIGKTRSLRSSGSPTASLASPIVEDSDLAELDRLVDGGLNLGDTQFASLVDQDLWQDMNKPGMLGESTSSTLRWGGVRGTSGAAVAAMAATAAASALTGSAPSSSSKVTPQRMGSCDEYEAALLGADAFTVEDHAASLTTDEDVRAQLATCDAATLDASFFTKFAINITPESVFGIDGTGAGVGVGASYYDDLDTTDGDDGAAVELNSRGAPRRKRKLSRNARSDWDLDVLVPLYANVNSVAASGPGRRHLAIVGGSSTGSSKRSDSDSVGSDEMDQPFSFVHESGRGDSRGKRQSRGKYKCSRCGEQKNNHTCSVLTEIDFTVSASTQSDPTGFSLPLIDALATGIEPSSRLPPSKTMRVGVFDGERVLTARPWQGKV